MKKRLLFPCMGLIIFMSIVVGIIMPIGGYASETLYWLTQEERDWLDEHPVITYAFDPEFAPFEFYDEDGNEMGISIEVIDLLESHLGVDIQIEYIGAWSQVVESLKDQEIDMISATPTDDRKKHMHFSDLYVEIPSGLIIREGNTSINAIEDLKGKKVSTVKGWSWNEIIAENNPELKLVVYDSIEEALNAVVYGDVDATIQDFGTASYHISVNKITNLKVVEKYDKILELSFAVRQDYEPLVGILNKLIPRISDEVSEIHDNWIKLDYEAIGDNTLLVRIVALITGVLIVVLLWTVSLKSQVNKKTKELQEELSKSEAMKKKIEEINIKLSQSERELRVILDADPSSIFVKDRGGRFLLVNEAAAKTVGVNTDEMLGKTMYDFTERINPENLVRMQESEDKLFRGEIDSDMYSVEFNDGMGHRYIHDVKKLPIKGDDGEVDLILSVASDITEIHNKNEELQESLEKLKTARSQLLEQEKWAAIGAFVAGIAHDVNTPLGSSVTINSHAKKILKESRYALETGTLKKSDLLEFYSDLDESMTMLERHLNQAADLIQNFKEVSVHQISEVEERFDVCEYLSKIAMGMKYECKMKGVQIELYCSSEIAFRGAPGLISQIFTNLIKNSLTHGYDEDSSGLITINAEKQDGGVKICYRDDGAGMSLDTLEKVFTPFYTTKREEGGSGLGMHIVHTLITENFGGSIEVASELGEGVEFIIFLPNRSDE